MWALLWLGGTISSVSHVLDGGADNSLVFSLALLVGPVCCFVTWEWVQDLGSGLCHVLYLKIFALLLWVCLAYAQLKSKSRIYRVLIINRSLSPMLFSTVLPAPSLAPWGHFPSSPGQREVFSYFWVATAKHFHSWGLRTGLGWKTERKKSGTKQFPSWSLPQDRAVREEREKENSCYHSGTLFPRPLARMRVSLRLPTHRL